LILRRHFITAAFYIHYFFDIFSPLLFFAFATDAFDADRLSLSLRFLFIDYFHAAAPLMPPLILRLSPPLPDARLCASARRRR
jgi:hypothetical protein